MAITLSGTNQGLTRTTSLHDYNATNTVTGWFYKTASADDVVIALHEGSSNVDEITVDAAELWEVRARSGGTGARQDDAVNLSLNTWYFFGLARSSVTDLTANLFDTSGSLISSPTATQNVTGRTAQNEINVGHRDLSFDWTGRIHCLKIWTAALTIAELQLEQWRVRPVRFTNLNSWYPLHNGSSTEHERDYFAGLNWTEDGTPTDGDPPPTAWGMPTVQVGVTITPAAVGSMPGALRKRKVERNVLLRR